MSLMRKMTINHFGGTVAHVQTNPWCAYFTVEKVKKSWDGVVLHRQNRTNDISTCLWMVTTSNWHHIDVQPNQWQVESSPQSWNLPFTSILYYLIMYACKLSIREAIGFQTKSPRLWPCVPGTLRPRFTTAQQAHGLGCPRGGILRFQETHHSWNVSHMGKMMIFWLVLCWSRMTYYYLNTISKLLNHKRTWLRSWVEQ